MRRRGPQGFTLIESLVVLAVMAVATAVVVDRMAGPAGGPRVANLARALVTDLREARARAIVSGREVAFTIGPEPAGWAFEDRRVAAPAGVPIRAAPAEGGAPSSRRTVIRFFPSGGSTGARIEVGDGGQARRISVSWLTGFVREHRE